MTKVCIAASPAACAKRTCKLFIHVIVSCSRHRPQQVQNCTMCAKTCPRNAIEPSPPLRKEKSSRPRRGCRGRRPPLPRLLPRLPRPDGNPHTAQKNRPGRFFLLPGSRVQERPPPDEEAAKGEDVPSPFCHVVAYSPRPGIFSPPVRSVHRAARGVVAPSAQRLVDGGDHQILQHLHVLRIHRVGLDGQRRSAPSCPEDHGGMYRRPRGGKLYLLDLLLRLGHVTATASSRSSASRTCIAAPPIQASNTLYPLAMYHFSPLYPLFDLKKVVQLWPFCASSSVIPSCGGRLLRRVRQGW